MMTSMLPYLTAIVRHQVQLHVSPPLHTDVAAQRRLNSAVGIRRRAGCRSPLPDSLPDLPRRIGELEARLDPLRRMLLQPSARLFRRCWLAKARSSFSRSRLPKCRHPRSGEATLKREAFKAAVAANTEQTRQLHAILIKAQKGKFVDADTAHSLEDLQKRNTHLLHINRVLRSHVSLAGMDPEILVLAVQGTGRR
ncbi:hypothetical protein GQ600_1954 [Phytophthora cactorum]|nr:hypothetical protein GQ600_1954 [Phytophthora cactorum]